MTNLRENSKENAKVEYLEKLYTNKKNCLWYGGSIANVYYKDVRFLIAANGDVSGDIYENGEFVVSFKDKRNQGNFAYVVKDYLPDVDSDEKLLEIINEEYTTEDIKTKKITTIDLFNNNWIEVLIFKNNEFVNDFLLEDTDDIEEAVKLVCDEVENIYNEYCLD